MKQKLLLFAFTILSTMLFSQATPMVFKFWETNLGTQHLYQKNVVRTDASGNVYTGGATLNVNGTYDGLLTKVSSAGVIIFTVQINGTANDHDFIAGMYLSGTDVFVTGTITNSVTMIPALFIAKYNSSGTQQFFTTYSNGYGDIGKDIVINAASNYILVTGASYNSNFDTDMSIIAFSSAGVQQWVNFYNHANFNDGGFKITTRSSLCTITGPVTISPNNYKLASVSYSVPTGFQTGSVVTGATATSSVEIISDLVTDASGNMYLCGATQQNAGQGYDIYVAKVTSTLGIVWEQTINGFSGSALDDYARGIKVDASSNVYVTGVITHSTQGKNIATVKLNSSGVVQWIKNINGTLNGDDAANDLAIDASANVYITGYQTIVTGNTDIYSAKLDNATGNVIWETFEKSPLNDEGTNLVLDNNSIIVAGSREITLGNFEYVTYKYDQYDIFPFTDLNSEAINTKSLYLPNKGQLLNTNLTNETDVLFYNLNNYPETYIAKNRLSFLQFHRDTIVSSTDSLERIDLVFRNANTNTNIYKEDNGSSDNYNFFVGSTKVTNIHAYNKIIAPEIYTGIDLHYYSNAAGVKAYFVVKPGADPKQISILLQGQQSATVTSNNLKIIGLLGSFNLRKPNVYNSSGGTNTSATGTVGWALSGSTVNINTGTYNTSQPLVIEFSNTSANTFAGLSSASPSDNLEWCTYYGNTANDGFKRIVIDKANNKYMAGTSDGNNYPTTTGIFQGTNVGATALVVTKFNYLNQRLRSTYYGGSTSPAGSPFSWLNGLAVDSLQRVFMAGRTNTTNFPLPTAGNQPIGAYYTLTNPASSGSGYNTGFAVKLDSSLQNNLWGTYLGGTGVSELTDIMVDKNQNVTVGGWSTTSGSFNFPTPPTGAYYNTLGTGLLFRFSNDGVAQYATRTSNRVIRLAENKANGDYFITTWLYTGDPGRKFKNPGGVAYYDSLVYLHDFYLARFNNQDSITWATVFGGTHEEYVVDMRVKDSTLILAGYVDGEGFPIKYAPGQYVDSIHSITGHTDYDVAFVRFNAFTGKWIYSSLYGGEFTWASGGIERHEKPTAIAIDDSGNYFIGGNTSSDPASGFHLAQSSGFYYSGTYYGNNSGFLLSYTKNNDLRHASYFGGRPWQGTSLGSDDTYMSDMGIVNNTLYVAGQTNANRYFPVYDASSGVAYFDSVLTSPIATQAYTDGFVAAFTNLSFVGVKDIDKNEIFGEVLVYPNPSLGIYTVEMKGILTNKNIIFNVYNVMGQIVYKDEAKTHDSFISKQINLSNLTQGVYFINIIQDNKSLTAKVIKQ